MKSDFSFSKIPMFYMWTGIGMLAAYGLRFTLARSLAPELYGVFNAVTGLVLFFMLFTDLGLTPALLFYLAKWRGRSSFAAAFSVVLWWKLFLGLLLSALLILFSDQLAIHYFHNPGLAPLLVVAALVFVFEGIAGVTNSYFGAVGPANYYAAAGNIRLLLFFIFSFVVVLLHPANLLMSFIWGWVLAYVAIAVMFSVPIPWKKILVRGIPRAINSSMWKYAAVVFMSSAGGMLLTNIDVLFITFFRPAVEVGFYTIALPTATLFFSFLDPLIAFLNPMIVHSYHAKKTKLLSEVLTVAYTAGVFVLLPVTLFVMLFAKEIIVVLFGEAYAAAAPALMVIAAMFFFKAFQGINFLFLYRTGRVKEQNRIMWQGAIMNVILNAIFIPHYGFVAAAWCTLVSFVFMLLRSFKVVRKIIPFSVNVRKWVYSFVLGIAAIGVTLLLKNAITQHTYLIALLLGVLYFGFYFAIGIFVFRIISPQHIRDVFLSFTRSLFQKKQ